MKIMKLVIGNSNNPYMTKVCTLKPILNPHKVSDTPVPPAMARISVVSCFNGSRVVP